MTRYRPRDHRFAIRRHWPAAAAFALTVAMLLLGAPPAGAGTYLVRECDTPQTGNLQPGAPDLTTDGSFDLYYDPFYGCGSSEWLNGLGIYTDMASPPGSYAAFNFIAPAGTRFTGGYADLSFNNEGGYEPRFSVSNGSTHQMVHTQDTSGWTGFGWGPPWAHTNQVTLWMACVKSGGNWCQGQQANDFAWGRQFLFGVEDYTAPSSGSLGGSLVAGGWKSGSFDVAYSGTDDQSGVELLDIDVNGSLASRETPACDHRGSGWYGRFRPCPSSHSMSRAYDVARGPFVQGANTVRGCVSDLSTSGGRNSSCTARTVHVDTVAPEQVGALGRVDGQGWRATNDFDLSWSTPPQPHAPIAGVAYRIVKPGGGYDSGRRYVSGASESLADVSVPAPGEYELRLWLRDEAGNESEANAQTTLLRYDPTVPPARTVASAGWLRRADFEHTLRWEAVRPQEIGPSGLAGYAVSVTQDPSSDPCATAADPEPACSAAEIDNAGIAATSARLRAADVGDGRWYAHVVPVSGAGVRAAQVGHTPVPVDTTDPSSSIAGVSEGWVNDDVTVSIGASDELSGMSASGDPLDPQPRTCIQLDDLQTDCEPDGEMTRVVSGEGAHRLRYFARDLAGNANDGTVEANGVANAHPHAATVRIDQTPPRIAFVPRDPEDPSVVTAEVTDPLSGVAGGTIEWRRYGTRGSWTQLDTVLEGSRLEAEVPDDVEPGRYEFRAQASDRAGNSGYGNRRSDGSTAVEELPLKEGVRLSARIAAMSPAAPAARPGCRGKKGRAGRRGRGGCRPGKHSRSQQSPDATPYGAPIRLSGTLLTAAERPLRNRELTVVERMAQGGSPETRTRAVHTDADGNYSIELPPGASRTVTVSFEGDRRYRPTRSDPVEVKVLAKVLGFASPRTVGEDSSIRFRGRIGVDGAALGAIGKRIELQYAKSRGNWPTIESAQTGSDGRFSFRYPLRSDYLRPTTVRFRIAVPPEAAWPYAGVAVSRPRATTILP
jgi:hypothetical protein